MTKTIKATVFKGSKSGKIVQSTSEQELAPGTVSIRIYGSGICGTDLHFLEKDIVLGHEGVGYIDELGEGCKRFKKGDRVGYGYEHSSCGVCDLCSSGSEEYCPERKMYGTHDFDRGAFSSHVVISENWVYKLPDELNFEDAAPLQCGGATVFGAMHKFGAGPTHRIGVVGVGGLGHLAIQFARQMGAEVVAFSHSDKKKEEAMKLGAHEYVAGKPENVKPVDYLIVTASAQINWEEYFTVLAPKATVLPLSLGEGTMEHPYMQMLVQGNQIGGSVIAPRHIHRRMMEFAARNGVKPTVETVEMSEKGLNEAIERLKKNDVRYRFVAVAPKSWM